MQVEIAMTASRSSDLAKIAAELSPGLIRMPFDPEPDGVVKVLKEFAVARGESGAGAGGEWTVR